MPVPPGSEGGIQLHSLCRRSLLPGLCVERAVFSPVDSFGTFENSGNCACSALGPVSCPSAWVPVSAPVTAFLTCLSSLSEIGNSNASRFFFVLSINFLNGVFCAFA